MGCTKSLKRATCEEFLPQSRILSNAERWRKTTEKLCYSLCLDHCPSLGGRKFQPQSQQEPWFQMCSHPSWWQTWNVLCRHSPPNPEATQQKNHKSWLPRRTLSLTMTPSGLFAPIVSSEVWLLWLTCQETWLEQQGNVTAAAASRQRFLQVDRQADILNRFSAFLNFNFSANMCFFKITLLLPEHNTAWWCHPPQHWLLLSPSPHLSSIK